MVDQGEVLSAGGRSPAPWHVPPGGPAARSSAAASPGPNNPGVSLAHCHEVFLVIRRRIGEADNPGPSATERSRLDTDLEGMDDTERIALVRTSRNDLAVALAGAQAEPCAGRPVFKKQSKDDVERKAPRRAPIQLPLDRRLSSTPHSPRPASATCCQPVPARGGHFCPRHCGPGTERKDCQAERR